MLPIEGEGLVREVVEVSVLVVEDIKDKRKEMADRGRGRERGYGWVRRMYFISRHLKDMERCTVVENNSLLESPLMAEDVGAQDLEDFNFENRSSQSCTSADLMFNNSIKGLYWNLFKDKGCDIGIDNSDQQKDNGFKLGDQEKDKGIEVDDQQKDKGIELGDQEKHKGIEVGDQQKDKGINDNVEKGDTSDQEFNSQESDDSDYIVDEVKWT
ncbi:hypothetical protein L6452_38891 [Arctium lappa]|uniref:Uncharacterized protein n=1 Tax=Arctium lappa TaxID=4217 RepID=A0ACB8XRD1_ARCLA|nr:hypothetical protein L6452_38891 [Arctium lappa]